MGLQPAGRLEVRSLGSVLELAIGGALSVFRREIQFAPKKQKFNLQEGRFFRGFKQEEHFYIQIQRMNLQTLWMVQV